MAEQQFVHLHNHSDYSLLDGAMKTKAMVHKAVQCGQPALALTDHGNLFGAVEFYLACRKAGIKPILGMEAYVARDRLDRSGKDAAKSHHTVLLVQNAAGWRNLIRLASRAYLEGFYYKPRIDKTLLGDHCEGLIALSACLGGEPNNALVRGDVSAAIRAASEYREMFGRDRYFLEIQNHGLPEEDQVRRLMPEVAREVGVELVATNDCHFLEREHHEAHDILLAIQTGKTLDEPGRWRSATPEVYFKTTEQMVALFADWPAAVRNTVRIAEMVEFELELGKLLLPAFPLPAGFATPEDYLTHLARRGLNERYGVVTPELEQRLEYELGVIRETGYAGYFLIVWDFIDAARRRAIPVGPGRGSAAGSLVCYCTGITDIDPLRHQLLFERFLNPERVSMPDIDVDFCFEKRPEIIRYVEQKYGRENVSQIITFGTMAARAVLKDVARVLGLGFQESDRISKLVPEEIGITLERALEEAPGLKEVAEESDLHAKLLRNALVLEGLNRNPGIHAAGVLITPSPLMEHLPLYQSTKGDITTQFDMRMSEELGLLKMDFLGLRTLTVIDKALQLVRETHGSAPTAREIPTDDPATYRLLQEGRTVGIFQLESSGMQELVRKMKPTCYEDITAINALFRPGPLGASMDQVFVDRKHGRKPIEYKHPDLEPLLRDTHGVILYQEQVMQIASTLGGFTLGQADKLRKAMGKKKAEMMDEMRAMFLDGAKARGYDQRVASEIFEEMAFFAQYGFNKSHSAAYALLSIQTAWLKAHHPAEFMAATLTSEMRKAERIIQLIDECKMLGLAIRPPSINQPRAEFGVTADDAILFGMGAVKGVGTAAIEAVMAAHRELHRPFRDLFDLCEHVDLQKVNRKVLESLIHAGALDCLPGDRATLIANLDRALAYGQRAARDREGGQASLFGGGAAPVALKPALQEVPPYDPLEALSLERQAVGFFLSGHPFQEYRELMASLPVATVAEACGRGEGAWVDLAGVVTSFRTARDKHKRIYARAHFEDTTGLVAAVVYARLYAEVADLIASDSILVMGGRVQLRSDATREIVVERVTRVDEVLGCWTREILLEVDLGALGARGLDRFGALLDQFGRQQAWARLAAGEAASGPSLRAAAAPADLAAEPDPAIAGWAGGAPPVPVVIDVQRDQSRWLLQSGRRIALTLASLRALRALPGLRGIRLDVSLPAAVAGRNGRGGWNGANHSSA
ncbi:MAG TPA: DNA polymerase III subunit alpha [Candidatus Krumholzibacteria bacterium]|nr:DNA polymerase III subunit alpha [Candidatus Krumholzibacteria bacterium]HPD71438.1 DNA polymerase III subunit alpha [Candidatus Krumholzibacteria bacterium]HRY41629.1 DNA polymerase III subunit alpha [Candidatus Krumholzibacteria bacterium]